MKYYFCHKCQEDHATIEDSDLAKRAVECDIHGHCYNASSPDKHSPTGYWCAYCARPITEAEYEAIGHKQDNVNGYWQ